MDCRRVDDWLPAYVEDALPSRRARAVATHLQSCPRCRREQTLLESALGALDRVGRRTPSIDLWGSFADRLAAEAQAAPRPLLGGTVALRRPFALAGSLALAVGACFLGLLAAGPGPVEPPAPASSGASRTMMAWRALSSPAVGSRQKAPAALRTLPPVRSPEMAGDAGANVMAVVAPRESPARSEGAPLTRPEQMLSAKSVGEAVVQPSGAALHTDRQANSLSHGIHQQYPERTRLAAIPSAELASVADALIDAQQNAARTQVANEVILLAEEMVRVSAPRDEPVKGRS
jgi:hypothetical protein